jgi:predicted permease
MFWRERKPSDFRAEIEAHLELETEQLKEQGLSEEAARMAARRAFGNVTRAEERFFESGRWLWWDHLVQDLRFGLRTLRRNPGFTAVAVLTLALGIGANTALFSVVNAVLLSPLPYWQPDRLFALYGRDATFSETSISYRNFLDWVRENRSFSGLAAYRADEFNLTGIGEAERVPAEMVSASFFPMLGAKPVIGRAFLPQEDQVGVAPVVLISSGLWKRKFGASPEALGKSLTLSGIAYTLVGVIPADFHYAGPGFDASGVYMPIGQWNDPNFRDRNTVMGMGVVGRLKPGVSLAQAKADMDALGWHLAAEYPESNKGTGIALIPLKQAVVGDIQPILLVLLGAVGFVLLIACVNVANLLLARSTGRTREFAIRSALGATRSRVIRQLLTESILLALSGGGLGLLLASWGLKGALAVLPEALPRVEEVHLDGRVLLFMLAASVLAGILFGLAPALKNSQCDLQDTLKEGGRGASGPRHRVQRVFVVVEMALAVVLLAGAGLMIRSLTKLWSVNPGFDPHNVLTFDLSFPAASGSPAATRATWRQIHDGLDTVPGIRASSLSAGTVPLQSNPEVPFWLEGQPKPSSQAAMKMALFYLIQPEYLQVMRVPLKRGRFLSPQDSEHSPFVVVIDDKFARLAFGSQDPIGRHVNFGILNITAEIVGVVGHVKQWGLDTDSTGPIQAQCYLPLSQLPDKVMSLAATGIGVAVRTAGSPLALLSSIRRALGQVDSQMVLCDAETMEGIISDSLAMRRFSMILLGIFAVLALVMSCVGIYGVISYLASQRTHEIGIRMALGAERRDVLRMVLSEGVKMTLVGVAIGLVAAFALTRLMASMLFGITAHDPLSFAGVAGLLILVALAACYIPARRATKVDPMVALRWE